MPRTAKKSTTTSEPETLGPSDVAPAAKDARTPVPLLDPIAGYLNDMPGQVSTPEDIITACFGDSEQAMPARVLSLLREVKRDPRFGIDERQRRPLITLVSGANPKQDPTIPADSAEVERQPVRVAPNETGSDDTDRIAAALDDAQARGAHVVLEPTLTIGEHLAATQAQPRFAYPTTPGMPVMLLTEGLDPAPAKILRVHDHGATCTYDLELADGPIADVPAHRLAPHPEAERVYTDQATRLACLERHQKQSAEQAQEYFAMQSDEARIAKQLSDLRKRIEAKATEMAEHNRSDAVQTMLSDIIEQRAGAATDTRSEVEKRIAAGDAVNDESIDMRDVLAAALPATASTGKPARIRPLDVGGNEYVLVDVQKGVAVLLPLWEPAGWDDTSIVDGKIVSMITRYGPRRALPSDEQTAQQAKGGKHCGCPVKTGRSTKWIGAEEEALLLRVLDDMTMPGREPEMAMSGKDAAAGG